MSEENQSQAPPARSKDEIALELMKFVAVTTGYGKGASTTGFGGKPRSAEEYAETLLDLFERCRGVVNK
jgi:ATP:corrinoid adenosyltransferase